MDLCHLHPGFYFFLFFGGWRWESGWLLHVDALAVTMVAGLESAWLAIYVRVLKQPMGSLAGQDYDCSWLESFVVSL